jgi:nucleoside-diphosphate-sugar epimerase
LLASIGATPARVDLFAADAIAEATKDYDVVINLATNIPLPSKALMPGAWKTNEQIRSEGSRILVDAALANGVTRYVQESIAFVYPDSGDTWLDEDIALDLPKKIDGVKDAEANARRFAGSGAIGVVLRFGQFYAADTGHTQMQLKMARRGLSPFPGRDDAYLAMIHMDDAASAVVASLDAPSGTYNVVDDEPVTRTEAARVVVGALGKKKLRSAPAAMLKVAGPLAMLTRSQRVSNARFKQATDWKPVHASAREGWPAVIAEAGLAAS